MTINQEKAISRREFLIVGAATISAAGLAACAPKATEAPAEPDEPTEAPAEPTEAAEEPTEAPEEPTEAPAPVEPVTVLMWKGPHKPAGDETELCARPTLDEFEADNPDIKVEFEETPWGEYNEKYTAAFASQTGADIYYMAAFIGRFAPNLLPLDELIESSPIEHGDFFEGAWKDATVNQVTYGIPWITSCWFLMWNKKMFEEHDLDPDNPPDTAADFLEACQTLTHDDQWGYSVQTNNIHETKRWPVRWGGKWFNEDYTKCTIDSPEAMEGWQFLWDCFNKHQVFMPGDMAAQEPGPYGFFRDEIAGMFVAAPPHMKRLREEVDWEIGVGPMSKGAAPEPQGRYVYGGTGSLSIAGHTENPSACWEVIQYLETEEAVTSWIGCLGHHSSSTKILLYPDDPQMVAAREAMEFMHTEPIKPWLEQYRDIWTANTEAFLLDLVPLEEGVQDMVAQIDELLASQ